MSGFVAATLIDTVWNLVLGRKIVRCFSPRKFPFAVPASDLGYWLTSIAGRGRSCQILIRQVMKTLAINSVQNSPRSICHFVSGASGRVLREVMTAASFCGHVAMAE